MIDADELAALQAEALLFLPDTTEVQRPARVSAALGPATTYNTLSVLGNTNFPCRAADLSGRELERAQRLAAEADVAVTVALTTPVLRGDRLFITSSLTGEERTVEVLYVPQRSWEVAARLLCKEIDL